MRLSNTSIGITQGPPGTGKTYLIVQTAIPFMLLTGPDVIFGVTSPSNLRAENLAQKLDHKFQESKDNQGASGYVLRVDVKGLEQKNRTAPIEGNKIGPVYQEAFLSVDVALLPGQRSSGLRD